MASRQERRKAERDAAKRAPRAGASGAAGAAAALAGLNVHPLGDWRTQTEDFQELFRSLGVEKVKQRAAAGDAEAQFSLGFELVSAAGVPGTPLGAGGRSSQADVGFALLADKFPVAHKTEMRDVSPDDK